MLLGVDLGSYSVKTSEKIIFLSKISETDTFVLRDDVFGKSEENKENIEKSGVDFDDDFDLFEASNLF